MSRTIAIMHDVELEQTLTFEKRGNEYLISFNDDYNRKYHFKIYKDKSEAQERFKKIADHILNGHHNFEGRLKEL